MCHTNKTLFDLHYDACVIILRDEQPELVHATRFGGICGR